MRTDSPGQSFPAALLAEAAAAGAPATGGAGAPPVGEAERSVRSPDAAAMPLDVRRLLAHLPAAGAFVVDHDLRYLFADGEVLRRAGLAPAHFVGRTVAEAMAPALVGEIAADYRRALAGEAFVREHGLDGRAYLTRGVPLRDEAGVVTAALAVSVDVTEQRAAEAALRASEARQRFLLALSDRLRPFGDADAILLAAARALGEHLGASRVGYAELLADGETSVVTRHYTDGVRGIEGRYRVADYSPALLGALREGRTVARGDVAGAADLTEAERAAHAALEVGAAVDHPLVKNGRLVGVLFMHHRGPHAWTADELTLLADVAARTWDAVERARAEAALRESEARLRASEARLRLALDLAELGTWTWDLATSVGDLDARGAGMIGLPPGLVGDVAAAQLATIHPDDLPQVRAAAAAGVARGEPFPLHYRVPLPDGRVRYIASRAAVLRDETGQAAQLVGTNRDVTADREREAERERLLGAERGAREAAEAANRAKGEFLAVMSHELRTPLNAIGGYAELLELGVRGPVTEQQRADLARIQVSQRHLLGLINQVLTYARVDAGAVRYQLADLPVAQSLAAAEALVVPQLRASRLTYVPESCPPALAARADREKLQQILLNLLSNAIKFTEPGGEIRVQREARGDAVAIVVADTGIGIAAEQLSTIFDPFVQADQRLTRPHTGVGLGLAISRDLARGMGGDLRVESRPGEGSTFSLLLPRA